MILFVTDSFLKYQLAPKELYFGPQLDVLAHEGIHHFEVLWSPDGPLAEGAALLRDSILKHSTPVIMIGHGKGGLDILECLIRFPEVRPLVKKFICLQAPIWGTPVADFLTGHPVIRIVTQLACYFIGGSMQALEELSEMNRQVYMILNRPQILKVLDEVEVLTVGSSFQWTAPTEKWTDRLRKRLHKLVQKYAGENDGLVPLLSTRIGQESHLSLSNVTHLGSVTFENPPELIELTKRVVETMSLRPSGFQKPNLSDLSEERSVLEPGHPSR